MEIKRIDTIAQFDALKSDWDRAYAEDPRAHVFVSWAWLRGWFEITPYQWFVLAAREDKDGPYLAFLPLAMRPMCIRGIVVLRELHMGGKPFADYTGFVSVPECEASALAAFGGYIRDRVAWEKFNLAEVLDSRLNVFLSQFLGKGWKIEKRRPLSCPYIQLPGSWNTHLQQNMSKKRRHEMQRIFRRVEELPGFRSTTSTENELKQHIDTLINLWEMRWGQMDGDVKSRYRHMFQHAFKHGLLCLRILWCGSIPLAALATFADPVKSTFYVYSMAYNPRFATQSPGKAIMGYNIRDAIEMGYSVYDFLLGGETYKYSFGAIERMTSNVVVVSKSFRTKVGGLLLWLRTLLKRGWR